MHDDIIPFICGFIVGCILMLLFSCLFLGDIGLAQKCAETQGKYDFCVQKVNWEVKN